MNYNAASVDDIRVDVAAVNDCSNGHDDKNK